MSKDSENRSEGEPNEIRWAIHDTNPELVENARAKISEVVDPEIGLNVVQLGLVRDLNLHEGIGHLKMVLTTPFCPYGPALIEMTRRKAEEALKKPVTVEVLPDVWDFSMMEDPSALDWGF